MDKKKTLIICSIVLLMILLFTQCSGGKKGTAVAFAEASFADLNAKKAVSLMSDEYLQDMLEKHGTATKKVLISEMQEQLDSHADAMERNYGKRWKATVDYIDTYTDDNGRDFVVLNITYSGKGGLFGLKDVDDTEEVTIALVKEGGKWRVDGL